MSFSFADDMSEISKTDEALLNSTLVISFK
ncbi:MAG: hypothetical protein CM15mP36_08330 [Flavobacteriales bacterium]|nr:MAG: hypothetical protein CM15mP36_08330 [Flavobacteriales bacterium]